MTARARAPGGPGARGEASRPRYRYVGTTSSMEYASTGAVTGSPARSISDFQKKDPGDGGDGGRSSVHGRATRPRRLADWCTARSDHASRRVATLPEAAAAGAWNHRCCRIHPVQACFWMGAGRAIGLAARPYHRWVGHEAFDRRSSRRWRCRDMSRKCTRCGA